jgi:hypothetical protein
MLARERLDLLVVDQPVVRMHAILKRLEQFAGEIDLGAMREMAAVIQAHAEDGIAGRKQRQIHRRVGLRARVRLHVGIVGSEQLLGAIDRELFGDVDEFAAAVVALARIAFRVLVGQHRALRLQDPRTGVILRSDQFDVIFLTRALAIERTLQFGVEILDAHSAGKHARQPLVVDQ